MERGRGRGSFRGRRYHHNRRGGGYNRDNNPNVDTSEMDNQQQDRNFQETPYQKPILQSTQQGGTTNVTITGYSQDTQRNDLLTFLNQNAKFRFLQVRKIL